MTAGETEKYATYMHDGRTDLAYADQRYYATGAGRFMTADPAGSGLNWYAYTGGDPVNNADPSGLNCEALSSSITAAGGVLTGCVELGSASHLAELGPGCHGLLDGNYSVHLPGCDLYP